MSPTLTTPQGKTEARFTTRDEVRAAVKGLMEEKGLSRREAHLWLAQRHPECRDLCKVGHLPD